MNTRDRVRGRILTMFAEGRSTIEKRMAELRATSNRLRSLSPELETKWRDEVRTLLRHPRLLGQWLEVRNPWLGRRLMGAASNLAEPFTVGMGFRIESFGEDCIEVAMPGGWRNQGEGGLIHSAALSALGEAAPRMFWERHLDMHSAEIEAERVQTRILARPEGEMKGVFRLPESDREAILQRLRAEGSLSLETRTLVYDRDGLLVAEVDVDWRFRRQYTLGPSRS